jgi:hypothetical protein
MALDIVQLDVQQLVDSWLEAERNGVRFPVPFDAAWMIAGYAKKSNGKRALKGLKEGKHFCSELSKTPTGGRPSESIQLSCDAMKHLCLMADTAEGEQIRDYFIQAEKKLNEIQQSLTPMEMIAALANKMVEVERKEREQDRQIALLETENDRLKSQMHILEAVQDENRLHITHSKQRLDQWDKVQSEARFNLIALPKPSSDVPEETLDMKVRRAVNSYCAATGQTQSDVFRELYKQFYYRYHRRVDSVGRESKLQAFVRLGLIQSLYDLAIELFAGEATA